MLATVWTGVIGFVALIAMITILVFVPMGVGRLINYVLSEDMDNGQAWATGLACILLVFCIIALSVGVGSVVLDVWPATSPSVAVPAEKEAR